MSHLSAAPLSPALRPLPRIPCRSGTTLARVPTNPAMPCAGVGDDVARQLLRRPSTVWFTAVVPIAFAAAAIVAGLAA